MVTQQLLDYIKSQKAAGVSKEEITKALVASGWAALDVSMAFNTIDGVAPPPPTTPAPPVAPMVPETAIAAQVPMRPAPTVMRPIGAASASSPRKSHAVLIIVGAVVLVLAGAGAVFAMPSLRSMVLSYIPGMFAPVSQTPPTTVPMPPSPPPAMSTSTALMASSTMPVGSSTIPAAGASTGSSTSASSTLKK